MSTFQLETPEAVLLHFPIADPVTRLGAFVLDIVLIAIAAFVVLFPAALLTGLSGLTEPMAIALIGIFLIRQFYFVFFEVLWHGATPGKRAMGLRVISRDGGGLTVDAVVARNLMRDVELFVPLTIAIVPEQVFGTVPWWAWIPAALFIMVIALLPLLTSERLRAGDLVGGTIVVRVPSAPLLADEAARTSHAPVPSEMQLTLAQLSIYGERELETLADLIRKIDEGKATIEDQQHIARTIARKIRYDGPEPTHEPTRFLRHFYKQQRAALEKQLLFGKRKASKND